MPEHEPPLDVLKVDNSAVRAAQIAKLARLRAERDPKAVAAALAALTRVAKTGEGNLLAASVEAARAKASVGEISAALETAFSRHAARAELVSGVYRRESGRDNAAVERVADLTRSFVEAAGRAPKILVAKVGQDGHDRGQKVIASAFADLGFDVVLGPLFATPAEAARQAVDENVHVVGVSSLAAGHLTLIPEIRTELVSLGRPDILLVVGGVIPPQDYAAVTAAGVSAIFPPGTVITDAALALMQTLNETQGFAQKDPAAYTRPGERSARA